MASGTADLQRDLGGALMTSIFGALLTAGYATAMGGESTPHTTRSTQATLQLSYSSAEDLAAKHPAQASQITAAAQSSFLKGDQWAYLAALIAILIGMGARLPLLPEEGRRERAAGRVPRRGHWSRACPHAARSRRRLRRERSLTRFSAGVGTRRRGGRDG